MDTGGAFALPTSLRLLDITAEVTNVTNFLRQCKCPLPHPALCPILPCPLPLTAGTSLDTLCCINVRFAEAPQAELSAALSALRVRTLIVRDTSLRLGQLSGLPASVQQLDYVCSYIHDQPAPEDLAIVSGLTSLTRLSLGYCNLSGHELHRLQTLTNLKELYLERNRISHVDGLAPLTSLTHLSFAYSSSSYRMGGRPMTPSDIGCLTTLRSLNLSGCPLNDVDFGRLTSLSCLIWHNSSSFGPPPALPGVHVVV